MLCPFITHLNFQALPLHCMLQEYDLGSAILLVMWGKLLKLEERKARRVEG